MAKKRLNRKSVAKKEMSCNHSSCGTGSGCFYFLGFIGAVIYYISAASGFWMGVLGVLKSLVWPVFLVMELLKFIGA